MTTYREAIYMCLDLLKGISDDFTYTEDHIAYLLDKFRALLLKQRYGNDPRKLVPYSNYQTISIIFSPSEPKEILKSSNKIPYMLQLGIPRLLATDEAYYNYKYDFTSRERLPFVGYNKYTKNITYFAINESNFLITPNKEEYWNVNMSLDDNTPTTYIGPHHFSLTGIFENPREVRDESSFSEGTDELDRNIPIEESLITTLIELVVKELASSVYRPTDDQNNNRDDNAAMATFLANNTKSSLQKQLEK